MSMHILPVYYTTNGNHKKRRKKTLNSAKYENACRQHNKFLKRHGLGSPLSLQQYIDNIHGRVRIDSKQHTELNLSSYTLTFTRPLGADVELRVSQGIHCSTRRAELTGTSPRGPHRRAGTEPVSLASRAHLLRRSPLPIAAT